VALQTPTKTKRTNGPKTENPEDEAHGLTKLYRSGNAGDLTLAHQHELHLEPRYQSWEEVATRSLNTLAVFQTLSIHEKLEAPGQEDIGIP
jgi:hypothetical protein